MEISGLFLTTREVNRCRLEGLPVVPLAFSPGKNEDLFPVSSIPSKTTGVKTKKPMEYWYHGSGLPFPATELDTTNQCENTPHLAMALISTADVSWKLTFGQPPSPNPTKHGTSGTPGISIGRFCTKPRICGAPKTFEGRPGGN